MKYLILLCFFFISCKNVMTVEKGADLPNISRYEFVEYRMKYLIFRETTNGQMCIINITKDSLECEAYKKQLNNK